MSRLIQSRILRKEGKPQQAIDLLIEHSVKVPTEAAQALTEAAECCLDLNMAPPATGQQRAARVVFQGDRASARRYFRQALVHNPRYMRALIGLANTFADGDPERKRILELIVKQQDHLLSILALGDYYRTQEKDFERAYDFYKKAIEVAPNDRSAYLKIQDICKRLGRLKEAEEWSLQWKNRRARFRPPNSKKDNPVSVSADKDGWIICPQCSFKFKANDKNVWKDDRHRRCGQRLVVVT